MNKNLKRPSYIVLILSLVFGTPLSGIFIVIIDTPITKYKDYPYMYLTWFKSECINMEIFLVLLTSTFYLLMWLYDKRHISENDDT